MLQNVCQTAQACERRTLRPSEPLQEEMVAVVQLQWTTPLTPRVEGVAERSRRKYVKCLYRQVLSDELLTIQFH